MSTSQPTLLEKVALWLLAILVVVAIGLQLWNAQSDPTPLEVGLFSVLQFVFAIGFAWILSRFSSYGQFAERQRAFAIAAYRRIKEIDKAVDRVIARTSARVKDGSSEATLDLEVLGEIAKGIKESIVSSTADWADIIGAEIETVERIEAIRMEEARLLGKAAREGTQKRDLQTDAILQQLELQRTELAALIASLPHSLRLIAEEDNWRTQERTRMLDQLEKEWEHHGGLVLEGFWDPTFEKDVRQLSLGETVTISQADREQRTG